VGNPAVVDAELGALRGSVSGTVTEEGSGESLNEVLVVAIDPTGALIAVARTAPDGTYSMVDVPAGPVRIRIIDVSGRHLAEYHDNVSGVDAGAGYAAATVVNVTGSAPSTVDAALAEVP
jgi:hypothetical protein